LGCVGRARIVLAPAGLSPAHQARVRSLTAIASGGRRCARQPHAIRWRSARGCGADRLAGGAGDAGGGRRLAREEAFEASCERRDTGRRGPGRPAARRARRSAPRLQLRTSSREAQARQRSSSALPRSKGGGRPVRVQPAVFHGSGESYASRKPVEPRRRREN
jgi:hypothetical protein